MSAKQFISATNVMFLIACVYFLVVAGLGEGSVYTSVGALLCFVAVALAFKKDLLVTPPWRTASAAFALIIFVAQLISNANSNTSPNIYSISSTLVNGALLLLFAGVLLATSRDMMRKSSSEEDEEEEKKPAKKLTYQV